VVKPPPPDVDPILQIPLDLLYDIPPGAIYSRIVEKCGDRQYWPRWAEDVAGIADRIRVRVTGLVDDPERITLQQGFRDFLSDMRRTLNPSVSETDVVAMVAQHLVTGPVFQALFANYEFAAHNPVSRALDRLVGLLEAEGLENETRDLEPFYESVRRRARRLDNAEARQTVLLELYERFFSVALRKDAERLGIVYTPVELVDFLLQSADDALRRHLGRSMSDVNVHILDPFTGTGTFIVRLLQNPKLIRDADLVRKFTKELHANEIVLLAYYIAAINIEEAYHGRLDTSAEYRPFGGIALADTFTLAEGGNQFAETMPDNSERVKAQQDSPVQVIVGNPPYSVGQRDATDDNPNVVYAHLIERIENTYSAESATVSKRTLYDSYKLALRWSGDRIGDQGVMAFVTNASFLRGNTDAGVRACLVEEFAEIYVFDLRGNARSSGAFRRKEAGNVFGEGSRAPIALSVLVKDPIHEGPARIHYRDIGDYLTREQKLAQVREFGSIDGITERSGWTTIKPDAHHDWFEQRDPGYAALMPLAIKDAKGQIDSVSAFSLFSLGIATNRDAWVYSYDQDGLWTRMQAMISFYEDRRKRVADGLLIREAAQSNDAPTCIKWTRGLRQQLGRNRELHPAQHHLRLGSYRPFIRQHLYFDRECIEVVSRIPSMFPTADTPNQAIAVPGRGNTAFSVLITDTIPDLNMMQAGAQSFSRWSYRKVNVDVWADQTGPDAVVIDGYARTDNITDWCLHQFQDHYRDLCITKDDIWHYVYGVLHAADFRERFASNLAKELPRIPFAPDFDAFKDAGEQLAKLHLEYETCAPWPVEFKQTSDGPRVWKLTRPMRWLDKVKRDSLQVTPQVTMHGIPSNAHDYSVNGRTPLEWAVDRIRIRTDKASSIVNDPNAWFADEPAELGLHLARLITVSVESARIIRNLPASLQ
ncbi:MAG: N-6 DNA methylase, partial [Caldilineaceae bacterium]|nr:N-6 DNA methylase [Caldilineaceae bacterium]